MAVHIILLNFVDFVKIWRFSYTLKNKDKSNLVQEMTILSITKSQGSIESKKGSNGQIELYTHFQDEI